MNKDIKQYQQYLLRPFETLSSDDVQILCNGYKSYGKEAFEEWLKKDKQTRCYASLVLSNLPIEDASYWADVHNEYTKRNEAVIQMLIPIFDSFHKKGGKSVCVYENFGAVLSSGESVGCFASGDVDLVVNDSEEKIISPCLKEAGFENNHRNDHATVSTKIVMSFYNPNALSGKGYWINIMRKPISRNYMLVQAKYKKRLNEECMKCVPYKDTPIRLLNPTTLVYYNALHFACEHHYSASPGMALCCDIDRVARAHEIDWAELARWAKEDNAGLRLHLAFDVCRFFLKTPIPVELFGRESKYYGRLKRKIIQNGNMVSQDGKLARLYAELTSDDMPLICALISRLWRR